MPSLSLNDIQMHYEHHNPGQSNSSSQCPLLLISGMASDSASWQPVVAELATHHELLIPDNRCTGRTRPTPVDTSRELMVKDILTLLDTLSIDRVNVLGHSMGGMIGWALAATAPDRVNHLISACALSHAIPARISLFKTLASLRSVKNEQQWYELLYHFLFSPSFFQNPSLVAMTVEASMAYPYKQDHDSFRTQAAALKTFQTPLDLSAIQCSVSLVTGANDLLLTPTQLEAFCNDKHYSCTIIADAAHALHWEQTQAFVEYVQNELSGK
ncbi:MAG: alpha/beta fold hydrolase [Granulosicoccus sp.]